MDMSQKLTRICMACGMQKPLAAFLQLNDKKATTYGNICSTCRSKGINEDSLHKIKDEERSSTSAGARIGAKEKYEIEKELNLQFKKASTDYKKEFKKRHLEYDAKETKKIEIERTKKARLQTATTKATSKNSKVKSASISKNIVSSSPLFNRAEQENNASAQQKNVAQTQADREELNKTGFNFTIPQLKNDDSLVNRSTVYREFERFLGPSAPLRFYLDQLYKRNLLLIQKNQAKLNKDKNPEEKIRDYITEEWHRPSSPRSR